MSWWDSGDDVIGDGPADALTGALVSVARDRERRGQSKPTLEELLAAFAGALRKIDGGARYDFARLAARPESAAAITATGERPADDLLAALSDAFDRIIVEYQRRFNRPPRLNELLLTLSFVLGDEPGDYLSNAERMKYLQIVSE